MALDIQRRRLVQGAAIGAATANFPPIALAQSDLTPLRDFFRLPQFAGLRLSADAKSILGMRQVNGRRNLFVFDVETRKTKVITNFADGDVISPRWISNDRIVFSTVDLKRGGGDQVGAGLLAIDKNADDFRELAYRSFAVTDNKNLLPYSTFLYAKGVGSAPDEVLVSVWSTGASRGLGSNVVHRLNTRTGRRVLLTAGGPPGDIRSWLFDTAGTPRIAVSSYADGRTEIYHRAAPSAAWKMVATYRFDEEGMSPAAFDGKGQLYVLARSGSDFSAVHKFDLEKLALDPVPVAAIKGYDLEPETSNTAPPSPGDPLIFNDKGELIGIRYHAERRGTFWVSEEHQALQAALEATFPGRVVEFQGDVSKKDQPLLVAVIADNEPARYFLYRQDKRQMDSFGSTRPWLSVERMAKTEVYRYAARDGLSIPATLTLPRGAQQKNLPLIVLHYGGPWARAIDWGFDANVQFLASRGYAVFMPAPRASTGFGWKHFRAGWKQWGLAMQDDVTDGVRELIKRGVADPKRICIAGASYGGYLTMMGLAKDPDLYRCGINWVGVTDPALMYIEWTDFAAGNSREVSLPLLLGDPKTDAAQFAQTSPLRRAKEITQPVLMAYGGNDTRVPIVNGEKMRDALRGHNSNVEWVVYGDEGHGWVQEATTIDFWTRVEAFLAKHMA